MKNQAITLFLVLLGLTPQRSFGTESHPVFLFYNRGLSAYFQADHVSAFEHFSTAITHRRDSRFYYYRALALLHLGRPDEADADFSEGANLELQRIDVTNLYANEIEALSEVSRALVRVQGPDRFRLERHRQKVYAYAREAQEYKEARAEQIRHQLAAASNREPERPHPKSLQDLVGGVIDLHGNRVRVLGVEEYKGGIRSLTVISADFDLNPRGFERTMLNTESGFVSGQAAFEYVVRKNSRIYFAWEIIRLENDLLPSVLVLNPLYCILSDPDTAAKGWHQYRENQKRREAALAAARQQAELERQLAEESRRRQRELEAEQLTRDATLFRRHRSTNTDGHRVLNLIIKGGLAWFANGVAHDPEQRGHVGIAGASEIASRGRNKLIHSILKDVFPDSDDTSVDAAQTVVSLALDGKLNLENLTAETAKDRILDALRDEDPRLAGAAQFGDFIYQCHRRYTRGD